MFLLLIKTNCIYLITDRRNDIFLSYNHFEGRIARYNRYKRTRPRSDTRCFVNKTSLENNTSSPTDAIIIYCNVFPVDLRVNIFNELPRTVSPKIFHLTDVNIRLRVCRSFVVTHHIVSVRVSFRLPTN